MIVDELIARLQAISANGGGHMPVMAAYNYGDHWHTEVARVLSDVDEGDVVYSDYHCMNKVVQNENDNSGQPAILLR
jgi:hypothetical protein